MKKLLILTIGMCLLFTSVPAMADQAEDEAAIRKMQEKHVAAWNSHDAAAIVATSVESAENWDGTNKGRAARQSFIEGLFAGPWKNVQFRLLDEIGVVFVTTNVAIYKALLEASGVVDEAGNAVPTYKILFANVYLKKDGQWLGAHGTLTRPVEE